MCGAVTFEEFRLLLLVTYPPTEKTTAPAPERAAQPSGQDTADSKDVRSLGIGFYYQSSQGWKISTQSLISTL
jgi:hypothetical protein